ncbi:MAG TPA: hypothetical protein ENH62_17105 [Marinobacter sp.]|uniref:Portal protein n=1 Tax=marine sediment metagenome TaxID=412755 RepID=A0A0F9TIL8_9ZZZZ|nr:hypothetical protein [Marinobacter sp.]
MPARFQIRPHADSVGPSIRPGPGHGEPTYETWKRRLSAAILRRDAFKARVNIYLKEIAGERGVPWGKEEMWGYNFWVNLLHSNNKIFLAHVYHQNPRLLVNKNSQHAASLAPDIEATMAHYQRELVMKKVNRRVIVDGYLTNMGVCKVGYKAEFGSEPILASERDEDDITATERVLKGLGIEPKEKKKDVSPERFHEFIKSESPFVVSVSPFDMLFPLGAKYTEELQWVAQEIKVFVSELKQNSIYKNTEHIRGTEFFKAPVTTKGEDPFAGDEEYRFTNTYEIHDLKNGKLHIIEMTALDFLYETDYPHPEIDGSQFVFFQPSIIPKDDIYGVPIPKVDEPMRVEFSAIRQRIAAHIDKFVGRLIGLKEYLSPEVLAALESGDVGSIIEVSGSSDDYRKVIGPFVNPGIGEEIFAHLRELKEDLRIVTGVSEAKRAGAGQRKTLGEAQLIEKGADLSISIDQDQVVDFVKDQSRKLFQVITGYVDYPIPVMVKGENGLGEKPLIPSEDLKADIWFDVQADSSQKPNRELQRAQAEQLLVASANIAEAMISLHQVAPDLKRLYTKLIAAHDEPNPEEFLVEVKPPPVEGQEDGAAPDTVEQLLAQFGGQGA